MGAQVGPPRYTLPAKAQLVHAESTPERFCPAGGKPEASSPLPTKRTFRAFVWLLVSAACTPVAPYERCSLAHPTMTPADIVSPSEEHVRAVQEGAIGGGGAAGGGGGGGWGGCGGRRGLR